MTENSSKTRKIFEPDNTEELLQGWLFHSHKGRQRHDRAARVLDGRRIWLGAAATIFAGLVSTSVFTDLGKELSGSWKIPIALISLAAPALSGLSAFLNLGERAGNHRLAGVQYKAMIRELERRLSEGTGTSSITPSVLDEIQKRLDELEKNAPIVPERIFLLVDKDWSLNRVEKVTKAIDLYNLNDQPPNRSD
jgi:hypothetical protein